MSGILRTAEEAKLDSTPISYGKYSGETRDDIAARDPKYIVWLYKEVKNRPSCSLPLAKSCGYRDMTRRDDVRTRDLPLSDANENRRAVPRVFDSYDDDIPF